MVALICDTEPRSCRRAQGAGGCGPQIGWRQQVTNGWRDEDWGWPGEMQIQRQEVRKKVCHYQRLEQCVRQLFSLLSSTWKCQRWVLSHRHTCPHCWHIEHVTDLVALLHEITCVHVTKVTSNERWWHIMKAALLPSFSLLFAHLAITPQVCATSSSLSSPPWSQMLEIPELQQLISALFCERICLWWDHSLSSSLLHATFSESCSKGKTAIFLGFPVVTVPSTPQVQPSPGRVGDGQRQGSAVLTNLDHLTRNARDLIHVILLLRITGTASVTRPIHSNAAAPLAALSAAAN